MVFLSYFLFFFYNFSRSHNFHSCKKIMIRSFDHNAQHFLPGEEDNKENFEVRATWDGKYDHIEEVWNLYEFGHNMRWKVWSYWRSMKWRCFGNKIDSDITRLGKRLKFSVFLNWDWLGEKVLWRQINFRGSTCIWRQCFKKLLANFANLANLNASTMLALIKILQKIALNLIY